MSSETVGEVETEGKVLVVRRIHVRYRLRLRPEQRAAAERAHAAHADGCPVYRSIGGCVEMTTSLEIEEIGEA